MKLQLALALAGFAALPSLASAQESFSLLDEPRELRSLSGLQEQKGEIGEVWIAPRTRFAASVIGRVSFPGATEVTIDNLWYSDFFDVGWGFSVEAELMSYVTPQWGVGGYISAGWDEFNGQTLHFFNGDYLSVGNMDQTNIIVGGKFQQQFSPWGTWEGRLGVGWLHYSSVKWSGLDSGVPFSDEELFKAINRAVFELGFRTIFGNRNIAGDFGFGFRYAGAAARGKDVSTAIDPDIFYTFMLELGLTVRF